HSPSRVASMLRIFLYFVTFLLPEQTKNLYNGQSQISETITVEEVDLEAALNYSCPAGFNLVRAGQCISYGQPFQTRSEDLVQRASKTCIDMGGQLIVIHDNEDQLYWIAQYKTNEILLGLACNSASSKWEWVDGSLVDYKPHSYYDALDKSCVKNCAWTLLPTGKWEIRCGEHDYLTVNLYCTAQLTPPPVPSGDGCEDFEVDNDDGVCYQVFPTIIIKWKYAQLLCQSVGANLASIHNSNENAFVRELAVSKGAVNGVFLGANRSIALPHFQWNDRTGWVYENFYPGFPQPDFGDYLVMDVPTGQWMNMNCGSEMPFTCIREKRSLPPPSCRSESYERAGMISSPGYPFNASMPCDYFLKVDAGRKVIAEIITLEANSCCDYLTLYDGYVSGKVIANLTDVVRDETFTTTSTNFMRVSWKPNPGVNVRGFSMTFRST
ncbi:hypothetical protein PRIPAC_85005, partial [Pristionchus pacificus]